MRWHQSSVPLPGQSIAFSSVAGLPGEQRAPGIYRVLSAAVLQAHGLPANQQLLQISLGEHGTTGYSVAVQKVLSSKTGLDVHLLAPGPSPNVAVGEALTYPGCAVLLPRDLKGPWRFYLNGTRWNVPVTLSE